MGGRSAKLLAGLVSAMLVIFLTGVLAAGGVIDLPGNWRTSLGFEQETPNPPCELGLFRKSPDRPPAPAGNWRFEPSAPRAAVEGSAIGIGDKIYATNGSYPGDLHRVLVYDTRSRRWSEPTHTPIGLNHSQAATYRGDLYLAGGFLDGDQPTNQFWRYDPEVDEWTELAPMAKPRGAAGTAVVADKLYVVGGSPRTFGLTVEGTPYGTLEIYDFKTGRWTNGPDLPLPRHHLAAAGLDGRLYVAGGRAGLLDTNNDLPPVAAFERYDPRRERWERLPEMPLGAGYVGMTSAAGKIVVVGGESQVNWENGGGWVTSTAWAFDPETDRWSRLPDLDIERRGMGAATVNGRIYVSMGSFCPGIKPSGPVGTHTVESLPVTALEDVRN